MKKNAIKQKTASLFCQIQKILYIKKFLLDYSYKTTDQRTENIKII